MAEDEVDPIPFQIASEVPDEISTIPKIVPNSRTILEHCSERSDNPFSGYSSLAHCVSDLVRALLERLTVGRPLRRPLHFERLKFGISKNSERRLYRCPRTISALEMRHQRSKCDTRVRNSDSSVGIPNKKIIILVEVSQFDCAAFGFPNDKVGIPTVRDFEILEWLWSVFFKAFRPVL